MVCYALLEQLQHESNFLIGSVIGVAFICGVFGFKQQLFRRMSGRRRRNLVAAASSGQTYRLVPLGATCIANSPSMMIMSSERLSLSQRGVEEAAREQEEHIYNSFLMGAYDVDTRRWQSVCWVDYGFTREKRKSVSRDLRSQWARVSRREDYDVHEDDECHVWFEPRHVWNIQTEKVYLSPRSRCAIHKTGASNQGIGLRFPRFKRIILSGDIDEERAEQTASSSDELFNALNEQEDSLNSYGERGGSDERLQLSLGGSSHAGRLSAPSPSSRGQNDDSNGVV